MQLIRYTYWLIIKFTAVHVVFQLVQISHYPHRVFITLGGVYHVPKFSNAKLAKSGPLIRCWSASVRILLKHHFLDTWEELSICCDKFPAEICKQNKTLWACEEGSVWNHFRASCDPNLWLCYFLKVLLQPRKPVFYDMAVFRWGKIGGLNKWQADGQEQHPT